MVTGTCDLITLRGPAVTPGEMQPFDVTGTTGEAFDWVQRRGHHRHEGATV